MIKQIYIERFLNIKQVRTILVDYLLSPEQEDGLLAYFDIYGYRNSQDRYSRLAWFIKQGIHDLILQENILLTHKRMSSEYFCVLYGETRGKLKWDTNMLKVKDYFPSRQIYWTNLGYSDSDAKVKVQEHQRKSSAARSKDYQQYSVRCTEYWLAKGYNMVSAKSLVSEKQRRGLQFYVDKHGLEDGTKRYAAACDKRKKTWKEKSSEDRAAHYLKTLQKTFNKDGQEMQAINLFLEQNSINIENCRFGPACDQFYQWIPSVGFRRYDLAVFSDSSRSKLRCIMEFHGPGHINFSDYKDELSDKIMEINGKALRHLGTYGNSYRNDNIKKNHILTTFPDVKYYVFWNSDLKTGILKINDLQQT
jgi:hypothetical protein